MITSLDELKRQAKLHSCYDCAHIHKEIESWEMPHIWWMECAANPGMANLKSFPFSQTKCKFFESNKK